MPRSGEIGLHFIDSHMHLSDYPDPQEALKFASTADILLVSAGVGTDSSARTLSISDRNPSRVKAFVGVHPSEAEKERTASWVEGCLAGASGVGEIGLDPKYSELTGRSLQMELFQEQLAFAEKAEKPVQVHSRGAERECLEVLATFRLRAVQLHWFQKEELVRIANEKEYYVSFGPALIVSKRLRRMAAAWERGRIMVESDGPVRFTLLGGAGGPWLIPSVVFKLAQVLGSSFEETARAVVNNSLTFLGEKA